MRSVWGILVGLLLCGATSGADLYTDAMYRTALEDFSTSPLFVLVTLHDHKAGTDRTVCIPAPFLLGAIIRERGLRFSEKGLWAAVAIAEHQPGRVFTFTRRSALANVQPRYTPELLDALRGRPPIDAVAATQGAEVLDGALRDARAHLLLESGVLAGISDMGGNLFVREPKSPSRRGDIPDATPSLVP